MSEPPTKRAKVSLLNTEEFRLESFIDDADKRIPILKDELGKLERERWVAKQELTKLRLRNVMLSGNIEFRNRWTDSLFSDKKDDRELGIVCSKVYLVISAIYNKRRNLRSREKYVFIRTYDVEENKIIEKKHPFSEYHDILPDAKSTSEIGTVGTPGCKITYKTTDASRYKYVAVQLNVFYIPSFLKEEHRSNLSFYIKDLRK